MIAVVINCVFNHTTMSIVNIPKTKSTVKFADLKITAFVDCSGSTNTKTIFNKDIYSNEELLAQKITNDILFWACY